MNPSELPSPLRGPGSLESFIIGVIVGAMIALACITALTDW